MAVADRYMPGWTGDNLYNPGPNWKDSWDLELLNQKRKAPFDERFIDLMIKRKRAVKAGDRKRVSEIDRRLWATERGKEERAINTLYRNLCKWEIDYKVRDGYTFGIERRNYKKASKVYNGYLYRQKRINGKKEHICLRAKSLQDYTFNDIEHETIQYKKNDRDSIVEKYRRQLGMKCSRTGRRTLRGYRTHTTAKSQSIHERKRILQAARKAFAKQKVVDTKIDEIGMRIGESNFSQDIHYHFIDSLIKESK
jgi:hypothetical protein